MPCPPFMVKSVVGSRQAPRSAETETSPAAHSATAIRPRGDMAERERGGRERGGEGEQGERTHARAHRENDRKM